MARAAVPAPLRHRGYRLLASGQLGSSIGDGVYAVALPWYVLARHGGPLLLAAVLAAYGGARIVTLALGGHASDRFRPWNVMMAADCGRAVAAGALAVIAAAGPARAAALVPVALVLGAGEGLFLPGSFAIVPSLLPDEALQAGNAISSAITQGAVLIGPLIGGAVVALADPSAAFAADAATFVLSALTLAGVRRGQRAAVAPPAAGGGDAPAPVSLIGLLARERPLQVMLLIVVAANLGSGGLAEVALPSLAHGPLHDGAAGYGLLLAVIGLGALAGSLAAAAAGGLRRPAFAASWLFLVMSGFLAAAPYLPGEALLGVALLAFGALNGFGNVVVLTAFQRWAPPEMLGRVTSLLFLAAFGSFPASVAVAGVVVRNIGPSAFFPIAAGIIAVAIAAGLSQRSWRDFGAAEREGTAQPAAG